MNAKRIRGIASTIGALLLAAFIYWQNQHLERDPDAALPGTFVPAAQRQDDANAMRDAFEAQQGDLWVESFGTVERTLKDDNEGSRHQRFIVQLSNGHTILIAHNIDLAERVPLASGDEVVFRGEFEWNPRGGVVHWTHHDPQGRREGGWIRHAGQTYR